MKTKYYLKMALVSITTILLLMSDLELAVAIKLRVSGNIVLQLVQSISSSTILNKKNNILSKTVLSLKLLSAALVLQVLNLLLVTKSDGLLFLDKISRQLLLAVAQLYYKVLIPQLLLKRRES